LRACLVALRLPEEAAIYQPAPPPLWRVTDAVARIQAMLASVPADVRSPDDFLPPLEPDKSKLGLRRRAALASTLVAGLELARAGTLTLAQEAAFGPVPLSAAADASAAPTEAVSA
jgi:segregation and condensation protein A